MKWSFTRAGKVYMAQERDRKGGFEEVGETLGGMAGKMAGQATDVAMNVAGTVMSSVFQAMGAWWSSADAQRASRSFGEQEDRASREHFERTASTGTGTRGTAEYERVRPLYQFGHMASQNPDYQNRSFDEVEVELQSAWARAADHGFGDWSEVRDYVNHGYTHRTPGASNPS